MSTALRDVAFTIATADGTIHVTTEVTATQAERVLAYARQLSALAGRRPHLSRREKQVLAGIACGQSYKQVAADLELSIDTVRTYVRSLYRKLGAHNMSEALARARAYGMV